MIWEPHLEPLSSIRFVWMRVLNVHKEVIEENFWVETMAIFISKSEHEKKPYNGGGDYGKARCMGGKISSSLDIMTFIMDLQDPSV